MGFAVAIVWIYSLANEIVNMLQVGIVWYGGYSIVMIFIPIPKALGVIIKLSHAVLGLTLLAWGNSIGGMSLLYTVYIPSFAVLYFCKKALQRIFTSNLIFCS